VSPSLSTTLSPVGGARRSRGRTGDPVTVPAPGRRAGDGARRAGVVEMVGAGPGDPDLLTRRAEAALAGASYVVADAPLAGLARRFAHRARVVVSAAGGVDRATVTRDATVDGDTIAVLVGGVRWGERVVRLYRGDPWLHPAYAVEAAILAVFGVEQVVVPGPAVELAVPGAAGVSVHDRLRSVTVTLARPDVLPPATDPFRTLVTVTDDAAGLAERIERTGGDLPLAVVTTFGPEATVHRGPPAEIAASPAVGPGVVVVGAVAEAPWPGPAAREAAREARGDVGEAGGVVHIVGAGPGDPQLVTRRAARLLASADVVVTDRYATDAVAALAPERAERHQVGRTSAGAAWPLDRLVGSLAEHAVAGRCVVRLKSGDPFVGSRSAEEVAALAAQGVPVTVTPGVTAATAAPLAAGVAPAPGTRITIASGVDDPEAAPVDWASLADPGGTLVVLSGRARQRAIAARLAAAGIARATPTAVVHAAGRAGTRVVWTDLGGLADTRLPPPSTIVIGPMIPRRPGG
jgi:uroporphyrin-III C-methyltransferase